MMNSVCIDEINIESYAEINKNKFNIESDAEPISVTQKVFVIAMEDVIYDSD